MTCPACGLTNVVSARRCTCGHELNVEVEDDFDLHPETLAKVRRENRTFALVLLILFAAGLALSGYACHRINTGEWLLM